MFCCPLNQFKPCIREKCELFYQRIERCSLACFTLQKNHEFQDEVRAVSNAAGETTLNYTPSVQPEEPDEAGLTDPANTGAEGIK